MPRKNPRPASRKAREKKAKRAAQKPDSSRRRILMIDNGDDRWPSMMAMMAGVYRAAKKDAQ